MRSIIMCKWKIKKVKIKKRRKEVPIPTDEKKEEEEKKTEVIAPTSSVVKPKSAKKMFGNFSFVEDLEII